MLVIGLWRGLLKLGFGLFAGTPPTIRFLPSLGQLKRVHHARRNLHGA